MICRSMITASETRPIDSLHRDRGPLDVKQPPEAESIEEGIHLARFDKSSGKMHLRSNHHRRGNYTTIANGLRSRSVYWFFHWFRRASHQAGEDVLLPHPPTPVDLSSLTIESSHALVRAMVLTRLNYCNGLLGGAPKCLLSPLSGVLWAAARLESVAPSNDILSRVTFKLCVLTYRCKLSLVGSKDYDTNVVIQNKIIIYNISVVVSPAAKIMF